MRRPTATTVSAARMYEPRNSSLMRTLASAACALGRARRFARRRGSPRLLARQAIGERARQLALDRDFVHFSWLQRIRLDAGLIEQRQPARRAGCENELGAADHQVTTQSCPAQAGIRSAQTLR